MKKLIFLIFFMCSTFLINAQSSQSLGLKFSYFGHNTMTPYYSPEFGVTHNYFLNENHGIINELNLNVFINRVTFTDETGNPIFTQKTRTYHFSYALDYMYKHKEWFVRSGFNIRFADAMTFVFVDETLFSETFFNSGFVKTYLEYHLGAGKDIDLGEKITIRPSLFIDKALNANYIEYGGSLGLIYKFEN